MPASASPADADVVTIGLMSGTSLDGLDGVLVRWDPSTPHPQILSRAQAPFSEDFRTELLALNRSGPDELHRAALAANRLSVEAAAVVAQLLERAHLQPREVAAIGLHGQTVRHRPGAFDGIGYTIQLHNASLLAELTGLDVICDFRSRDVAAGGQGAPLVPAFHADVFAQPQVDVAVLNLGGIANLTLLHGDGRVAGFDCGPANVLMDLWAARHLGQALDAGGAWAAQGQVQPDLLEALQGEPFFGLPAPKSTGRDLFSADWLAAFGPERHAPVDVQSTLCELSAWAVQAHLQREMPAARRLLVCGGGAFNDELMRRLKVRLASVDVQTTESRGLGVMDVEAAAFAWLARRFLRREPGNLVRATGARGQRVLGALYPGSGRT